MACTSETVIQVWDDKHGDRVEVGPDRDGLELVEIRCYTDSGEIGDRITMTPERAILVAQAILKLYNQGAFKPV
jgi:hypothetical protein